MLSQAAKCELFDAVNQPLDARRLVALLKQHGLEAEHFVDGLLYARSERPDSSLNGPVRAVPVECG